VLPPRAREREQQTTKKKTSSFMPDYTHIQIEGRWSAVANDKSCWMKDNH